MGINLSAHNHCCITDSQFKKQDDAEHINSKNQIEKEPFKIAEQLIDTGASLISDFSPSRQHSKNTNAN
jgi:hypothetical protein